MQDTLVKAYGMLRPADGDALSAAEGVLSSWFIEDAVDLDDGALWIHHEGTYFPHEELASALAPFLCPASTGKMDIMDLEAWTLCRYYFSPSDAAKGRITDPIPHGTASLDRAVETCQNKMS